MSAPVWKILPPRKKIKIEFDPEPVQPEPEDRLCDLCDENRSAWEFNSTFIDIVGPNKGIEFCQICARCRFAARRPLFSYQNDFSLHPIDAVFLPSAQAALSALKQEIKNGR